MSGNYVKAFTMPEGFPEILREFSKELLREKPDDVYKYAYELFMNKVEEIVEIHRFLFLFSHMRNLWSGTPKR